MRAGGKRKQRNFNQTFFTVKLFNNSSIKFTESMAVTFGKGNRTFCQKQINNVCILKALTHQGKNPLSAENSNLCICAVH